MAWFIFFFAVIVLALLAAGGWLLLHAALDVDERARGRVER